MNLLDNTRNLLFLPQLLRPRDRIFMLSHMRANTSLMGHILGSHPEIEGYYELHQAYARKRDFLYQKLTYYREHRPKRGARFMFDKLLHNRTRLDPSLLRRNDRILIMIREPTPSVDSIVRLFRDRPGSKYHGWQNAEAYYRDRLRELAEYAVQLSGQYVFVSAEAVVDNTDKALTRLTNHPELVSPLSSSYRTFSKTGKKGAGDSSEHIQSGRVVQKTPIEPINEAAPETIEQYRETRSILLKHSL